MLMKFNKKIPLLLLLFCSLCFSGCIKGCKKNNEQPPKTAKDNNASKNESQYTPADLLLMGDNALGEGNIHGIPDYTYNRAIGYYRQVTLQHLMTNEAVEAQFKIAKYTEEKIKYLNSVEIQIRKQQMTDDKNTNFETNIRPFLNSYNPAINEYFKLHNFYEKNWRSFSDSSDRQKAYTRTTDALLRAANLLCDESNPRIDRQKAIEIYNLVINRYGDSGFADLACLNVINIYMNLREWQQVINYSLKFKDRYPTSAYFVDVEQKLIKANAYLTSK